MKLRGKYGKTDEKMKNDRFFVVKLTFSEVAIIIMEEVI